MYLTEFVSLIYICYIPIFKFYFFFYNPLPSQIWREIAQIKDHQPLWKVNFHCELYFENHLQKIWEWLWNKSESPIVTFKIILRHALNHLKSKSILIVWKISISTLYSIFAKFPTNFQKKAISKFIVYSLISIILRLRFARFKDWSK